MRTEPPAESPEGRGEASASRRFPRYPFQVPFLYRVPGTRPPPVGVGWTRHLSEGGAGVELGESLSPGSPLTLLVQTEQGPFELHAEVAWCGGPLPVGGGLLHGLAFPAADPKARQALRDLLQVQSGPARAGLRLPVAIPATCQAKYPLGTLLQGRTGNISREGLLLLLPEVLAPGTVLAVTLDTRRGPVSLEGVVAWVDASARSTLGEPVRHGVQLTSRDWATALALGRLVVELA